MRIIAIKNLVLYWRRHPETTSSLEHWISITKAAQWETMSEVKAAFSNAVVLNADRVRFEVHGGNYRLIVAFNFRRKIAFVSFLGTHKEYDRVDALTVRQF